MNQPRINALFEKTKPVCFGRFVIDVPAETTVLHGSQDFSSPIETVENGASRTYEIANKKNKEVIAASKAFERAEVHQFEKGPTPGSWTLTFWESKSAKKVGLLTVHGYLATGKHAFIVKGATSADDATEATEKAELSYIASNLRARTPEEIPAEPGVCLNLGFIADNTGQYQEIFGIGFRFPSLPDVSLSISSNKDGQTPKPLSARRKEAEKLALGSPFANAFRQVKTLREGQRKVDQWAGEEALFRRPREEGGVWHEFRYEFPGIRYDRNNPNLSATLFTGVERNTAGAKESGLTDDEAIALWDRMLSTLRLRVPVK